eukprot:TRINITY_DN22922_c0_g2_i2.p1 TRINITY_DN22922_c0_g2~~TRINITY_DN22922_c0_g2_i2.p1  ORF type:complete len:388 (-),score=92.57 TRINITY_DN22922_c0_g2_i2:349-1512(-)
MREFFFFFFKQKTAYEMLRSLVGSEMCIRDRYQRRVRGKVDTAQMVVARRSVNRYRPQQHAQSYKYHVAAIALACGLWLARWSSTLEPKWTSTVPNEGQRGLRVLVTGASSGIGEHLAYEWAARNASLLLVARRGALLEQVAQAAIARGATQVHIHSADFSERGAAKQVMERCAELLGGVDVLQSNHAWLHQTDWVTAGEMATLERMIQVSFTSHAALATAALPYLMKVRGRIVVSSSAAGETAVHAQASYSGAKHALHGFFESFQQDLAWHSTNVSITMAVIGRVETAGSANMLGKSHKFVPTVTAEGAAAAIVSAALSRESQVRYPWGQVTMNWWFASMMPRIHGALVTLCAQSHPCTNTHEMLLPVKCFSPLWDLVVTGSCTGR